MVTVKLGNKKKVYRSIKEAAADAKVDYMTFYMRLYHGWKPARALKREARKYVLKVA